MLIVAPTRLEWLAARVIVPGARIQHGGVALSKGLTSGALGSVITCGLAGALDTSMPPGTVFVPSSVARPSGERIECDGKMVDAFKQAAKDLGYAVASGLMVTSDNIVTGLERARWANEGFAAVDMETGKLTADRVASVRVILDTPEFSLAEDWEQAGRAIWRPRLWRELAWLSWNAPRYAVRAARVVKAGLELVEDS